MSLIHTQESLVTIKGLHFHFNQRNVFEGVDLTIPRGKITAIMGPSGAGKSTLIRLIGGQLQPDQGTISFAGTNIHQLHRKELYHLRRYMGVMFQSGALFTNLSVFDNVAFPLREHTRLPEEIIRNLVLMKLQIVGLRGAKDIPSTALSGGMARRVALARAIALDPMLIMYDEPFTGLDPISLGVIVKLIRSINDVLGMTTVLISHDVMETASIADYVYVLSDGKIVGQGTPKELLEDKTPAVQQFMNGIPDGVVPFHYTAPGYREDLFNDGE